MKWLLQNSDYKISNDQHSIWSPRVLRTSDDEFKRGSVSMPRTKVKNVLAIIGILASIGMVIGLPWLRSMRWDYTRISTTHRIPVKTQEEIEEEQLIEKAAAVDESEYTQDIGIRYLKRIPTSKIDLEAAFRQRRSEAAVMLHESEPLFVGRYSIPSKSSKLSGASVTMHTTRKALFSIGLEMRDADIATLPWISRSSILSYIRAHYVSLQANILKDSSSGSWYLHHRPIAGVAKFGGVPLTQSFVSPITETVGDIRGLGTYLHPDKNLASSQSTDQTAVWLFRTLRMDGTLPVVQYDYAFVRTFGADLESLQFKVILTTNNRSEWNCLPNVETARPPLRSSDTTTLGTVHFIEYASDGLHPKTSVTRSVRVKSNQVFKQVEINDYLASKNLHGDWGDHIGEILDHVAPKQ